MTPHKEGCQVLKAAIIAGGVTSAVAAVRAALVSDDATSNATPTTDDDVEERIFPQVQIVPVGWSPEADEVQGDCLGIQYEVAAMTWAADDPKMLDLDTLFELVRDVMEGACKVDYTAAERVAFAARFSTYAFAGATLDDGALDLMDGFQSMTQRITLHLTGA